MTEGQGRLFEPADEAIRGIDRRRAAQLDDELARRRRVYGEHRPQNPKAWTPCPLFDCRRWEKGQWATWTHLELSHGIRTRAQVDEENDREARIWVALNRMLQEESA